MDLTGHVSFRLTPASRKRRRNHDDGFSMMSTPLIGYVFQDDHSNASYLLAVPRKIVQKVCDAAHYGYRICITNYAKVSLSGHSEIHALLEVHSDGLTVLLDQDAAKRQRAPTVHRDDILTLPQVRRREAIDKLTRYKGAQFTFRATVSAISPILTFDPSDPCSLMELYDPETSCSCVAVLRQSSLTFHAGIIPGQDLVLCQVKRQAWTTPSALAQKGFAPLSKRIPNHVFLVDTPDQLQWCPTEDNGAAHDGTYPLKSVAGTIESVHMVVSDTGMDNFRYLALIKPDGSHCNLFLTYFPLASDMQQALQPGATIEAFNLHRLGQSSSDYCACLRSTICLGKTTFESSHGRLERDTRSLDGLQPCACTTMRTTYAEWICRHRLDVFFKSLAVDVLKPLAKEPFVQTMLSTEMLQSCPRIAYAEFFDHGLDDGPNCIDDACCEDDTCTEHDKDGCSLSGYERLAIGLPSLIPLRTIRQQGLERAMSLIDSFLTHSEAKGYQAGWTGSSTLDGEKLAEFFRTSCGENIYTGGTLSSTSFINCSRQLGCLLDTEVSLPISFERNNAGNRIQQSTVLLPIMSITTSFIYLGHSLSEASSFEDETRYRDVCAISPFDRGRSLAGSCTVVHRSGHLFVVSMRIEGGKLISEFDINDEPATVQTLHASPKYSLKNPICSIRDCLDPAVKHHMGALVEGVFVRKFFKPQKLNNGLYKGSMFVFAHASRLEENKSLVTIETSTVQTIDVKPPIKLRTTDQQILRRTIFSILGVSLSDEQLAVAVAWWSIADNEQMCALLSGGWEELVVGASSSAAMKGVLVRFPQSKLIVDKIRGYVRIRCSIEDLIAFPLTLDPSDIPNGCTTERKLTSPPLHFIGGQRFFPGMLSRRPRRKLFGLAGALLQAHGELLDKSCDEATPSCSLAELHWKTCEDLRLQTRTSLAPSLVWKVQNATTLGIVYCSAVPECTKCFSSLRNVLGKQAATLVADGLRSSIPLASVQPSYWKRPLPGGLSINSVAKEPPVNQAKNHCTPLRCPKKCSISFAGIKWECSCILDDGTGQAKLLAERDAALLLLGMSKAVVQQIELGAWLCENGVVFSKGMPPKVYLRGAIQTAQGLARDEIHHRSSRPLCDEDVLKYLTPTACAEYLMQRHCRESKEPFRDLIYYVRCKPMSDAAHLNQTCIESSVSGLKAHEVHRRDVASYSLPALKLNLVDCSVNDTTICEY